MEVAGERERKRSLRHIYRERKTEKGWRETLRPEREREGRGGERDQA